MTFEKESMKEWYLELNTIDQHLEVSANNILASCERLSGLSQNMPEIQEAVGNILENCNFHDLNSQRLRKIIDGLRETLQSQFHVSEVTESSLEPRLEDLQSGPQRAGRGLSQEDVERLLKSTL